MRKQPVAMIVGEPYGRAVHLGGHYGTLFVEANTQFPSQYAQSMRMYEAYGTMWYEVNTAQGVYNWTKFDAFMALIEERGIKVAFWLDRTPTWASARPAESTPTYSPFANGTGDGSGSRAEPANMQNWVDWCAAVATRYKGRITAYCVQNEPATHFTGTEAKLIEMQQLAYQTIKGIDPAALILSPDFVHVNSATDGVTALNSFLANAGSAYCDVVAFHFYGENDAFSDFTAAVDGFVNNLNALGRAKPRWATECGFGTWNPDLAGLTPTPSLSDADLIQRLLERYHYLRNRGFARIYFLGADSGTWGYWNKPAFDTVWNGLAGAPASHALPAQKYTIGGTVTGLLNGKTVTLRLSTTPPGYDVNDRAVSSVGQDKKFVFYATPGGGDTYAVTVLTQPVGQTCTVTANGSGTVGSANITNVQVTCV